MKYVVIGAGAAGQGAVRTIIKEDSRAEVTVITQEHAPFYFRPMIVDLINRSGFTHDLAKPPQNFESVHWILGHRVKSIDPKKNQVLLSNKQIVSYDFLVIATGSISDIEYLNGFQKYLLTVHTYPDIIRIKRQIENAKKVVVTGGGYIAVEIIRQLRLRKIEVIYIARADLFWPKDHPGISSNDIVKLLSGVDAAPQFENWIVDVYDFDGVSHTVVFHDGSSVVVDAILAVPSEVPNIGFLQGSGIQTDEGIVVNEELRTNIPNIFACGDCAQVLDLHRNVNRINFGWRSAEKQGEIAGTNAVGKQVIYVPTTQDFYFLDLLGKNLFDRWLGSETPSSQ